MPFLVGLSGVLLSLVGSLVGRVLLALGIGFVTYKGFDVSANFLMDQIKGAMAGLPRDVADFLAFCWIDKAIKMVFSAWLASLAISGLSSGVTKMRIKGGG